MSFHTVVYEYNIRQALYFLTSGNLYEAYSILSAYASYLGVEVDDVGETYSPYELRRKFFKLYKQVHQVLKGIVSTQGIEEVTEEDVLAI